MNKILERKILLMSLFFYAFLVLFGVWHHEPWRDEAHPWMIARENTISTLINERQQEGTPMLWFLVLMPFAKLGFPYITMNIVHALIAIAAVGIFLFYAKIPLKTKILFTFSYYVSYEYAVVARNYVLTIFILFLIAVNYTHRLTRPLLYALLLVLLFQTNSLSFGIAGVLGIEFLWRLLKEKKLDAKNIAALAIVMGGAILTVAMLYNPKISLNTQSYPAATKFLFTSFLRNSIAPSLIESSFLQSYQYHTFIIFMVILCLVLFLLDNIKFRWRIFLFFGAMVWLFYVNSLQIIHTGIRHQGLVLIFIIFFWWVFQEEGYGEKKTLIRNLFFLSLNLLLIVSWIYSAYIYYQDYRYSFSGASDMANYIKSHNLESIKTVAYPGSYGEAILPYFKNKKFWYPEFEAEGYFNVSDYRYILKGRQIFDIDDALTRVSHDLVNNTPLLVLLNSPIPSESMYFAKYQLLHSSQAKYFWSYAVENFWLYARVKE